MKTRLLAALMAVLIFVLLSGPAAAEKEIKFYIAKATESGSIPDDLKSIKKQIEAKGYKGAEIIKSGNGDETVKLETHGYSVTIKFSDGKARLILKKGKKVIFDGSTKKDSEIWGPKVDDGQLLFVFRIS